MSSRQQAIDFLKFVRGVSEGILNGIPDDRMTMQAAPTDNHPLWVLGHLASTDVWFAGVLGIPGVTVPDSYNALFGMGSKPVSDRTVYPPVSELRQYFNTSRAAVLKWYESASDAALKTPLTEKTGGFMNDPIDGAMKLGWHEGWHMGQAASVRKALGLKPVMG